MARHFSGDTLIIASHNPGKVREIAELLSPFSVTVRSASDLGLDEPEETGITFQENAELKARAAAEATGLPALADDSGIVVAALDGAPGIHSARWGGAAKDFAFAMARVHREIGDDADRSAWFTSVLSLCWPDGHCESFEGRAVGHVVWPPRGDNGFGYDPMFQPDGLDLTFGEMEHAAKEEISHRTDAFRKLITACFAAEEDG